MPKDVIDSEERLERLVKEDPDKLLLLIEDRLLPISLLTFAAELAGRIPDKRRVHGVLKPLLWHDNPIVREGAIYGLCQYYDDSVDGLLENLMITDECHSIRVIAAEKRKEHRYGQ